jgi:hypothetical protein
MRSIPFLRRGALAVTLATVGGVSFIDTATAATQAVDANISNTVAAPVPVVAVPTATPQVMCWMALSSIGSGVGAAFVEDGMRTVPLSGGLHCPSGVTTIDVTRVAFDPYGGLTSKNIMQTVIAVGLVSQGQFGSAALLPFVTLSLGTPEGVPSEPVRLNTQSTDGIIYRRGCGSGNATYSPVCGGMLFFTGTPR